MTKAKAKQGYKSLLSELRAATKAIDTDPESVLCDLRESFAGQVRQTLRRMGRHQVWLAKRLGVSRQHVSRLLSGESNMGLATIARVVAALDHRLVLSLVGDDAVVTVRPRDELQETHPLDVSRQAAEQFLVTLNWSGPNAGSEWVSPEGSVRQTEGLSPGTRSPGTAKKMAKEEAVA